MNIMRKFIVVMLLLGLHTMARGQTGYECLYWFDNNPSVPHSLPLDGDSARLELDIDELARGIHTLHLQVVDSVGVASSPRTCLFINKGKQGVPLTVRYWFDSQQETHSTVPNGDGRIDLDASSLTKGLHMLHCLIEDEDMVLSSAQSSMFIRTNDSTDRHYHCWFDENDSLIFSGKATDGIFLLDVSSLSEGFHSVRVSVSEPNSLSCPESYHFVKVPQTMGVDYMECLLFVDDKLYLQERFPENGGAIHMDFDVSRLDNGLHYLQAMVVTPTGAASELHEGFFYRMPKQEELDNLKLVYYIDKDTVCTGNGALANGKYEFMIDVTGLENGVHQLGCHLVDERGNMSDIRTFFFMKMPDSGDGICQYEYWVNDSVQKRFATQLEEAQNPFSLVTMIPVEPQPIRTDNFYFQIEKGTPRIYGRNTLHLRFMDTDARITESSHPYIDMAGSAEVVPVGPLQPIQEFEAVAQGNIRWYSIHAEAGDSIALKSSLPCTLQLFSPLSKEVYKAQAAASLEFGGSVVAEAGIYYLAIHDVTGNKPEMSIELKHLDKDGKPTGIGSTVSEENESDLYDLDGRRVNKVHNGVYVKDGKKILYHK